ncbi:MAG TPA: RNA ligase family protein [Bryobacteraceae bacterium]|nr:RNA ligase family protein [Bryobacteraceae bacterium]
MVCLSEPFDHPDWLFELKWDGFRAVAYIEAGGGRLVSRNGNIFKSFPGLATSLAAAVGQHEAILDGEIVALDGSGRAQFYPLLHRRADPYFYAFDCLWLDGRDLRCLPLVKRKAILRRLVPRQPSRLLYVDHIDGRGVDLFREICRQDLEGIVAKQRDGVYDPKAPTWIKIKNPDYSQAAGRHEFFDRRRVARPIPAH